MSPHLLNATIQIANKLGFQIKKTGGCGG
jgi:hypothetical protein